MKGFLIFVSGIIFFIIFVGVAYDGNNYSPATTQEGSTQEALPKIGDTVSSSRFSITLHNVQLVNQLSINSFSSLESIDDSFYVIIEATWENIDNETRSIWSAGSILFNWNGQEYSVDSSEIVFADGWGFLDTLAPFQSHKTKIAFSVPFRSGMEIMWEPVRNEYFFLDTLHTAPL